MSKLKKIPEFKNEAEERSFWENHDSSDYLDWDKAQDEEKTRIGHAPGNSKTA
jgi:hypothetical protein